MLNPKRFLILPYLYILAYHSDGLYTTLPLTGPAACPYRYSAIFILEYDN
jgi:hypothetical protein